MVDPEGAAADLLARVPGYVWDGTTLPVPVETIADSVLGLRIHEAEDLAALPGAPHGVKLSGLLIAHDRAIWVNRAEAAASPGRRRFTIGHEAGHWCLHRTEHDTVFCRSHSVTLEAVAVPDIEEEASRFSGALMFPPDLVRGAYAKARGDLMVLTERFGASKVATQRAVFRLVHAPAVRERAPGLVVFFWDEDGYDAYRAAHLDDAFVCNDHLGDPEGARLHRLACHHLARIPRPGQPPRTSAPKWCSPDPDELRKAFPKARPCTSCESAFMRPRRR